MPIEKLAGRVSNWLIPWNKWRLILHLRFIWVSFSMNRAMILPAHPSECYHGRDSLYDSRAVRRSTPPFFIFDAQIRFSPMLLDALTRRRPIRPAMMISRQLPTMMSEFPLKPSINAPIAEAPARLGLDSADFSTVSPARRRAVIMNTSREISAITVS